MIENEMSVPFNAEIGHNLDNINQIIQIDLFDAYGESQKAAGASDAGAAVDEDGPFDKAVVKLPLRFDHLDEFEECVRILRQIVIGPGLIPIMVNYSCFIIALEKRKEFH